jgi:allophanate hydrolase
MIPALLEIGAIHAEYRAGALTPRQLVEELLGRMETYPDKAVFISLVDAAQVLAEAEALDMAALDQLALFGIPFVVKDNIDVAGMQTTAACPDFADVAGVAARDAVVVARLRAAGAILLGKTNLDQFATGLNGTRSPYGAPRSVFNSEYISGGSSSGSAVAVGAGLAVFALGTDTAGSGRVPAAFNNLIGLKPSIGRIPATGVVPACRTLDCVSIFANGVADALRVLQAAEGTDAGDAWSRASAEKSLPDVPRIGVLAAKDRDFAGDAASAALYEAAVASAEALGWQVRNFDYSLFREIAAAVYGGAFVAERLAAIRPFFESAPDSLNPVVRGIIEGAQRFSAADAFAELYRVRSLCRAAQPVLTEFDALLLPTAPTIFTVAEMSAEPITANAKLGIYTNFVNFMDLAAIALPAGFRPDGLPFGISLIGAAFSESSLAAYADALHVALGAGAGAGRVVPSARAKPPARDEVKIIVAGAHLSGMVLNHELTSLGARRVAAAKTAPGYKLFALATSPPKPGLVRAPGFEGQGIDVEIWALSREGFGRFVAALPEPMGIGKVTLADGSTHPGFLCEAYALVGGTDITGYGGWRAYRAAIS